MSESVQVADLKITVSDYNLESVTVNGETINNVLYGQQFTKNISLSWFTNYLTVYALDDAGNYSTDSSKIIIRQYFPPVPSN